MRQSAAVNMLEDILRTLEDSENYDTDFKLARFMYSRIAAIREIVHRLREREPEPPLSHPNEGIPDE